MIQPLNTQVIVYVIQVTMLFILAQIGKKVAENFSVITNIKITSNLIKLKYIQNYEELDLTDGEIQVTRNNGSVEEIPINTSGVKVTGFNNQNLGEQDITVSYGGKSASFEICVTQGEIKDTTTKFIIQRQEM